MIARTVRRVGSISVLAGPPVPSREPLKPFQIPSIRFVRCISLVPHQFVQVLRKDGPDRVKSVVPTETLVLKTGQSVHNPFLRESELVFYYDVNNSVKLRIR